MHRLGWRFPLDDLDWRRARQRLTSVNWAADADRYPVAIIDSVLAVGADRLLALTVSMHDLIVAPRPADSAPVDVVVVSARGSLRRHPVGTVRIDWLEVNGRSESVVGPASQAVPLFWAMVGSHFGLRPNGAVDEASPAT